LEKRAKEAATATSPEGTATSVTSGLLFATTAEIKSHKGWPSGLQSQDMRTMSSGGATLNNKVAQDDANVGLA